MNYWLFNYNDEVVNISEFLEKGHVLTVPVESNKDKITKCDKVIIWVTGSSTGCLGLGSVISEIFEDESGEKSFVTLLINFNLRTTPISKKQLGSTVKSFNKFYKKLKKDNYPATENQYNLLLEVIQENGLAQDISEAMTEVGKPIYPHNTILYGPTGTGKTYRTINYALAIIEQKPMEEIAQESRRDLRARYEQYMETGFIHFITFHENFTYQDFVESTRTNVLKGTEDVQDGIFKQVAIEAKRSIVESLLENIPEEKNQLDFNQLYKAFLGYLKSESFKSFKSATDKKIILHKIAQFGHITVRPQNSFSVHTASKHRIKKLYDHFSDGHKTQNLVEEIKEVIGDTNNPMTVWAIFTELKKFEVNYRETLVDETETHDVDDERVQEFELNKMKDIANFQSKRHVLIIDEINRGDIAKTFGEILSILSSKKREGAPEAQAVILPYSKTYFSIPPNLYLIGTMNIKDSELAKMDAGLRARFQFVRLHPRPEVLPVIIENGKEIDLAKMLFMINKRIHILLGEDHGVGHAYLMNIENFQHLKMVFFGKVLPLLIDYFNGDSEKIGLVLGKGFFHHYEPEKGDMLANFYPEVNEKYSHKTQFLLKPINAVSEDAFIDIYKDLLNKEQIAAVHKSHI